MLSIVERKGGLPSTCCKGIFSYTFYWETFTAYSFSCFRYQIKDKTQIVENDVISTIKAKLRSSVNLSESKNGLFSGH